MTDTEKTPDERHDSRVIALAGLVATTMLVGAVLSPALLVYQPLVLLALSPLPRHLVLAAAVTQLPAFLAVVGARRLVDSLIIYHVGEAYVDRAMVSLEGRSRRLGRLAAALARLFRRAPHPILFVIPGWLTYGLAGGVRMRKRVFVVIVIAAQAIWITVTYKVGDALSAWVSPAISAISSYTIESTALCILVYAWVRVRRKRKSSDDHAETRSEP